MKRIGASIAAGVLLAFAGLVQAIPASASTVLNVPGSYPTIQAAINASSNGDTVVVAPGTYVENIDFKGKLIAVESSQGPAVTIIDGGQVAPVVNFSNAETSAALLQGFTIQHGYATFAYQYMGGGVHIASAGPTIAGNVITANSACGDGAGISVYFSSPIIEDNTITGNAKQSGCSGDAGGAISIGGAASAQILRNVITNNSTDFGGGISLNSAGTPILLDNTISGNTAAIQGGGIWAVNQSDAAIVQNLITGNTSAGSGGAVYISPPYQTRGALLVNNTLAGNRGSDSSVYLSGFDAQVQLSNNIVSASTTQPAVLCDQSYSVTSPVFDHNDLFNNGGPATQGSCAQAVGTNGNISADPQFVGTGDYHLVAGSPAVDAGNSSAPSLPATDLDAKPRICGVAVDQGAYELQRPLALAVGSGINAVEGSSFSATLGSFSGGYGPFSASVDWGDGQITPATISGSAISGTHAYAEEGTFTVTVAITDSTSARASGTITSSVADAALTLAGSAVSAVEGGSFSGTVATFTDADPNGVPADYSATINWGDQTSSAGTIALNPNGGFVVNASHSYAEEGAYVVMVTVSDAGTSSAAGTTSATVADAALAATGKQLSEHHKTTFTATVATLTDADPAGVAGDYTGQINWGDGTTSSCPSSTCTIVRQANGTFNVSASHNYKNHGSYTVTIQLADAGGASARATTTVVVN